MVLRDGVERCGDVATIHVLPHVLLPLPPVASNPDTSSHPTSHLTRLTTHPLFSMLLFRPLSRLFFRIEIRGRNKLSLSSDKTGKPYKTGCNSSSLPRDLDERNANASRGNSLALGGDRHRKQRGRGGKNSERQGWNSWRAERTAKRQKMEGESKERQAERGDASRAGGGARRGGGHRAPRVPGPPLPTGFFLFLKRGWRRSGSRRGGKIAFQDCFSFAGPYLMRPHPS